MGNCVLCRDMAPWRARSEFHNQALKTLQKRGADHRRAGHNIARPFFTAIELYPRVIMRFLAPLVFTLLTAWLWWRSDDDPRTAITLGILMIVGVTVSAIYRMLHKIIPALLWNHAQMRLKIALPFAPKIKDILPDPIAISFACNFLPCCCFYWPVAGQMRAFRIYVRAIAQIVAHENQPR